MTEPDKNTPAAPAANPAPSKASSPPGAGLDALLGAQATRRWWQRPVLWVGVAGVLLAAGGGYYWQAQQRANAAPRYVTEEVRRGNLTLTVSANGTLQPTRSVNIGS